jgi:hypothetical protein
MRKRFLGFLVVVFAVWSCSPTSPANKLQSSENRVMQENDGTVSLILEKASRYCDNGNPSNNTADWNVVISKPGRFKVWLSSATKDTSKLNYANSVRISLLEDRLEATPTCDKIIRNSQEVQYPFYRADSYMGSIWVQEPGEYNIQIISEKVVPKSTVSETDFKSDNSKLMAVILSPITN